ncbi:TRAP transporter small permease [Halomonas sp. AOP12-C2-37]|uniref:TRAP transporter small permease n=1 Tax=unclassified Halomonas TaxID=2609666 RepID=UPI004034E435
MLTRLGNVLEKAYYITGGLFFLIFIITILFQVFARNILSGTYVWTDEVAMFCFIWSVFLGAAVGFRKGIHYVVEIFPAPYTRINGALRFIALLLCVPLVWVFIKHGMDYAQMGWRRQSFSIGFPMFYQSVALPLSAIAMAFFTVELVVRDVRSLFRFGE